ncbi:MAG TPA: hypothetical protein EYQ80_06930 [Candidatus Poseidoniales archaeon]|nr:hypothetical protein [Candidatus Poseidoniales archaeon]
MGLKATDMLGTGQVGVHVAMVGRVLFAPLQLTKTDVESLEETLGMEVAQLSIGGSALVGALIAGNTNGIAVADIATEEDLDRLTSFGDVVVMESGVNAAGNLLIVNENGVIASSLRDTQGRMQSGHNRRQPHARQCRGLQQQGRTSAPRCDGGGSRDYREHSGRPRDGWNGQLRLTLCRIRLHRHGSWRLDGFADCGPGAQSNRRCARSHLRPSAVDSPTLRVLTARRLGFCCHSAGSFQNRWCDFCRFNRPTVVLERQWQSAGSPANVQVRNRMAQCHG